VRATRMLVLHEFRRYVRIPVMTEVLLVGDGRRISTSSIEMSSGGMSIKSAEDFSIGTNVEVSFALMTLPRVNVRAVVSWRKPKSLGVRFDAADERRHKVKIWIDSYLEN
jgi:Tfp pilus assembly protein PilZ